MNAPDKEARRSFSVIPSLAAPSNATKDPSFSTEDVESPSPNKRVSASRVIV